jgi:predicted alpha/beta superfamily hydrolase
MIAAFGPAHAVEPDIARLQGLGDTRYHMLDSELLGRPLHLFVRLPAAYNDKSRIDYPTVYLLDGGITYPMLSAYYHYLLMGKEVPTAILVGISYGTDQFSEGNYRSTDYTAPSEERDHWGGAAVFQKLLQDELLPLIEKNYRSDAGKRVIFGQSMGGQFVLFTALTRPELFWGHIASNPALHRNLPFFLQWQGKEEMPVSATRLFVSSGEFEAKVFREPAMEWIAFWTAQPMRPWILESRTLDGQSHFSAGPAAFRQGMAWLFPEKEN